MIAPITVEDCFWSTIDAFNYSERFQVPVIQDRLRDHRLEPGREERLPLDVAGERGQRDGGDVRVSGHRPDGLEALQAVDRRHADVQHQQIRRDLFEDTQRLVRGAAARDAVLCAQEDRQDLEIVPVVVDEQQPRGSHGSDRFTVGGTGSVLDHRTSNPSAWICGRRLEHWTAGRAPGAQAAVSPGT